MESQKNLIVQKNPETGGLGNQPRRSIPVQAGSNRNPGIFYPLSYPTD
jgi:hypothetical protein